MSFALSNGTNSLGKSVQSDVIAARNIRTDALTTNRLTVTGGAISIREEGVDVLSSSTLNFVGSAITASDDGSGVADVTVTIPTPTIAVREEGVAVNSATTLNFVGDSITASDGGGGVATITVTIPTPTIAVQEEGVAVVSASSLNFVGSGVTASNVAGVATVTVSPPTYLAGFSIPTTVTAYPNGRSELVNGRAVRVINGTVFDEYLSYGAITAITDPTFGNTGAVGFTVLKPCLIQAGVTVGVSYAGVTLVAAYLTQGSTGTLIYSTVNSAITSASIPEVNSTATGLLLCNTGDQIALEGLWSNNAGTETSSVYLAIVKDGADAMLSTTPYTYP